MNQTILQALNDWYCKAEAEHLTAFRKERQAGEHDAIQWTRKRSYWAGKMSTLLQVRELLVELEEQARWEAEQAITAK